MLHREIRVLWSQNYDDTRPEVLHRNAVRMKGVDNVDNAMPCHRSCCLTRQARHTDASNTPRYVLFVISSDASVATAARAAATERVSMSTRPDPDRSGAVEIATRRCRRLGGVWDLRELTH